MEENLFALQNSDSTASWMTSRLGRRSDRPRHGEELPSSIGSSVKDMMASLEASMCYFPLLVLYVSLELKIARYQSFEQLAMDAAYVPETALFFSG
jgi:hypothetical protein